MYFSLWAILAIIGLVIAVATAHFWVGVALVIVAFIGALAPSFRASVSRRR